MQNAEGVTEQKRLQSLFCTCIYMRIFGALIAFAAGSAILFLFLTDAVTEIRNPYWGIFLYLVLPVIFLVGVILVVVGVSLCWRARQKSGKTAYSRWPLLDLNDKSQRRAAVIGVLGIIVVLIMGSAGIYQSNHYMDTVTFCGKTCHTVMTPEYTTYQESPHAHVKCVDCHIGPTAAWFVRAKLSGLYQVYATIVDIYPRPIPVPLKDLRPVQAACLQCHWPQMFFGSQEKNFVHYRYDKSNTVWPIRMLVKTGGSHPATLSASGIHWHVSPAVKVEYIARDKRREDIPWVKVTQKATGEYIIFQDTSDPLSQKQIQSVSPRLMDCIDCHNNPSHDFRSPDYNVDQAILSGKINRVIPYIKKSAVNAMLPEYASDDAMDRIHDSITGYYKKIYPGLRSANEKLVSSAIRATQEAFQKSIFPDMKVRWTVYPNHIGHLITKGCARCHGGRHKSSDGIVIPNNCDTCHIIISQGDTNSAGTLDLQAGLEFKHPVDIGGAWHGPSCYLCHRGTEP